MAFHFTLCCEHPPNHIGQTLTQPSCLNTPHQARRGPHLEALRTRLASLLGTYTFRTLVAVPFSIFPPNFKLPDQGQGLFLYLQEAWQFAVEQSVWRTTQPIPAPLATSLLSLVVTGRHYSTLNLSNSSLECHLLEFLPVYIPLFPRKLLCSYLFFNLASKIQHPFGPLLSSSPYCPIIHLYLTLILPNHLQPCSVIF